MRLFAAYTNYSAAIVDFSALQAGGFDPFLRDLHQCTMTPFHIYAYGGVKIDLPDQQLEQAVSYLKELRDKPITDFDPIQPNGKRDFGLTLLAIIGFFPGLVIAVALPILFVLGQLTREDAAAIWSISGIFLFGGLCLTLIYLHSRRVVTRRKQGHKMGD